MSRKSILAGKAHVEIGLRSRIAQGARTIQNDLNAVSRKVTALGRASAGIGLTLGAPFAFAAGKLAAFDDGMRAVGATVTASTAELAMLTETAKVLGRTTSFTAVEVSTLMLELGRAFGDANIVNDLAGSVLDLARATGTDAALAAQVLGSTIRQFGLEASDAARVADVLTAAANTSNVSVESMSEALKFAGVELSLIHI